MHQGRKAADKVDAHVGRRRVQRLGKGQIVLFPRAGGNARDGRDRHAGVDHRHPVFQRQRLAYLHQMLGPVGDLIVDPAAGLFDIGMRAVFKRKPHGDGADI